MQDMLSSLAPHTRLAVTALHVRAQAALKRGDRKAAIEAYREIVALAPQLGDYWYEIGYLLRRERQPVEALAAYQAALDHGARDPQEIHLNRAVILSDELRRYSEAESELETALRLRPDYAAAWFNLGNLHEDCGRADAAAECYERILETADTTIEPVAAEAAARHLRVKPPSDVQDCRLQRLLQVTRQSNLPGETRAMAGYELGQALESLGDYQAAFEAYRGANLSACEGHRPYQARRALQAAEAITEAFSSLVRRSAPDDDAADMAPVFICGLHRSGSTLLEQVLCQHPELVPGGELDWFSAHVLGQIVPFPEGAARLTQVQARQWREAYPRYLEEMFPGAASRGARVINKRPENFMLIGLILFIFPRARILHTVRDGRDVAVSLYAQHLDPRIAPHALEMDAIASHLRLHHTMMQRWRECFPDAILDVRYESLVQAPEQEIVRVLQFLGLEPAEGMLEFHKARNPVKTASAWQVRRPLNASSIGRWRRFREPMAALFQAVEAAGLIES
jgi:tetratricopeptide (TPR) repeat protein